ncbi:hypothetical protein FD723_06640 [Nostoc sp. C052]|uniref:hypothetical protein n=1 Tax=Nostoc sp. C052 TaxID=2576902 RepID=UPI0015C333E1|nr:hypothetical protein [Nostoc sp. C052]QLE40164.1 hypothetical protein FD723_06640 [Nostoc sp. C052]
MNNYNAPILIFGYPTNYASDRAAYRREERASLRITNYELRITNYELRIILTMLILLQDKQQGS